MEILQKNKQEFDYKMVIYYKMDVSKKTVTTDSPHQNSSLVDEYEWNYYKNGTRKQPQSVRKKMQEPFKGLGLLVYK